MSVGFESAGIGTGRLRALLAGDRRSAGETRQSEKLRALQTIAYQKSLRVWLRIRWRRNRRLRILVLSGAVIFALALCVRLLVARRADVAPHALPAGGQVLYALAAPVRRPAARAPLAQAQPVAALKSTSTPQAARTTHALSPRRRLQRADLWLRVQTPRGDAEARQLLESGLVELPKSAHGHAALAEACLRLDDATCARGAIQKAIQVRPQRAKYRALEAKISHTFALTGR